MNTNQGRSWPIPGCSVCCEMGYPTGEPTNSQPEQLPDSPSSQRIGKEELKRRMNSKARAVSHRKDKRKAARACISAVRDFLTGGR